MRHIRFVLVAAAVISVTGLAAAARWSGTRMLVATGAPTIPAAAPVVTVAAAPRHPLVGAGARARTAGPADAVLPEQATPVPAVALPTETATVAAVPVEPLITRRGQAYMSAAAPPVTRPAIEPASLAAPNAPVPATMAPTAVEAAPDSSMIFRRANAAREMGDHERAGELYRRLLEDFGSSPEARASLPMFGRMLLDDGNASGALRRFDDALRIGGGALREDVMLGRALALQRLARPDDEGKAWSSLLDAYPSSVHAERARRRLLELGRR
jgi:tetratricopeptide (TPR) repeat protein